MAQKQFVILDNKDLAIINGSSGLTQLEFTRYNVSDQQSITFATTNPCVAIMDNDGVQWDLNSRRVRYTSTNVIIDLTDILYAKDLVTTPATISTSFGVYQRDKSFDTESGYSWMLSEPIAGVDNIPQIVYTKEECPAHGDAAYYSGTATGAYIEVDSATLAVTAPISGTWRAIFTVSTASGGGGGGSVGGGIEYDVITD